MFDQQVTFLYTRDLDKSAAFYGEVLGLPASLQDHYRDDRHEYAEVPF